jgi:hypothetical protein
MRHSLPRIPRFLSTLVAFSALQLVGLSAQAGEVLAVRVGEAAERTRVVLDLTAPADYRVFSLEDPQRLVLDLSDSSLADGASIGEFRGGQVLGLRHAGQEGGSLRIVLDLTGEHVTHRRFQLPPDSEAGRGHRLVIDLYGTAVSDERPEAVAAATPSHPGPAAAGTVGTDSAASTASVVGGITSPSATVIEDPTSGADERSLAAAAPAREASVEAQDAAGNPGTATASAQSFDDFFATGPGGSGGGPEVFGYFEPSIAYTYAEPEHWSKLRARLELGVSGDLGQSMRYRMAVRLDGDGAYVVEDDFYPGAVRDDQRFEAQIREFYLDFGGGRWAHRVGRQHIVWGEMVGLFLADVVSARDTREFFLQEFEAMRIPQWAWNTQYFAGDSTLEFVYIPVPSVDVVGEPGADFYPFPVPAGTPVRNDRPERDLDNYNWGVRASTLKSGWSLSAYYYDSISVAPTLVMEPDGLTLQYDPVEQFGGTFSKDFGGFVFKGEAVYARSRRFQSLDPEDPFSLPDSDAMEWVVGAMVPLGDWRVDLQLYGRRTFDYDPRMGFDENEYGATVLINYAASSRLELEMLALTGLNREDYLVRPKLAWRFAPDWRLQFGADIFGGDPVGLFGPYDDRDRIYLEVRRWF